MGPTIKKIAIVLVLLAVAVYLTLHIVRAGGISQYINELNNSSTPTPTPTASVRPSATARPLQSTAPTTQQSAVLSAMNSKRAASGSPSLVTNATLQSVAQSHAADMAARGYFSHTDPQGVTFQTRISKSGYTATAEAENIGLTSGAAVTIIDSWMASTEHRTNLLNSTYVATGVGVATGPWQGHTATFVVAVFGNTK